MTARQRLTRTSRCTSAKADLLSFNILISACVLLLEWSSNASKATPSVPGGTPIPPPLTLNL